MNQEKTGKFISAMRKEKGLTQEQLAENLNISKNAVSKWERGMNLPDASNMQELCAILDITINELFIGEKLNKEQHMKVTINIRLATAKPVDDVYLDYNTLRLKPIREVKHHSPYYRLLK